MSFRILSMPTAMRRFLVASCLADVTQQIHSLRASGVMAVQSFRARLSAAMAFRKSAGKGCTVPPESFCVVIGKSERTRRLGYFTSAPLAPSSSRRMERWQ